jgi:hypothetical protein
MARRSSNPRRAKKSPARKRLAHKRLTRKSRRLTIKPAALDDLIAAGSRALNLKIAKPWMPTVVSNLQVILLHGMLVAAFSLSDDAEPAPVFEA